MGNKHTIPYKIQEFRQNFLNFRCTNQHTVCNAGKIHDLLIQLTTRVNKGLETVDFLAVLHDDGTDFDDGIVPGGKSGGFQIKGNKFVVEGNILAAVNHDPVIHIVDVVAFAAVEDLDGIIRSCHLGRTLPILHGMKRIGKGLAAAVIGDGNGPMSPCSCLLDSGRSDRQGIHGAHIGMQVQFHPLLPFCKILPLGKRTWHHGKGLQDHFIVKLIDHQLALDPQHHAVFHIVQERLRLIGFHKAVNTNGAGIVGHIKIDDPGISLFQFLMLHRKNPALHDDTAHIQIQLGHGNGCSLEGLAVQSVRRGRRRRRSCLGRSGC